MANANPIRTERLAIDLFRQVTCTFRVKPQPIPQASLQKNVYSSDSYIKDIARPVLFYAILSRDSMRERFEKFPTESMSDSRDKLEILSNTIFNMLTQEKQMDIHKRVAMSVVTCVELIQYLNVLGKREFLKDIPGIWADIFESQLSEEFQVAGGFDEYISKWSFLKFADSVTLKYMKRCSNYHNRVSVHYLALVSLDLKTSECQRKILDQKGDSLTEEVALDIIARGISQVEPRPPVQSADIAKDQGESSSSQSNTSASRRPKKLKPKPGQSYAIFQAERRAQKQGVEKDQQDVEDLRKRVEKLESSGD